MIINPTILAAGRKTREILTANDLEGARAIFLERQAHPCTLHPAP